MASIKFAFLVAFVGLAVASPAGKTVFWKDTPLDGIVNEMRANCDTGDSMACIKVKVMSFLDTIFRKDHFQLTDDIEVRSNGYVNNESTARAQSGILEYVENYLQSHDITFKIPSADAKLTLSPRNINNEEINLKVKFAENAGRSVDQARRSKLKKVILPIMVLILLKAMTVIPLAIGVLGLKAWNSLQLGFLSFLVSAGLAIFQLCKKLAIDHHPPHIAAHGPWDGRQFAPAAVDAQNLAYNAYS